MTFLDQVACVCQADVHLVLVPSADGVELHVSTAPRERLMILHHLPRGGPLSRIDGVAVANDHAPEIDALLRQEIQLRYADGPSCRVGGYGHSRLLVGPRRRAKDPFLLSRDPFVTGDLPYNSGPNACVVNADGQ